MIDFLVGMPGNGKTYEAMRRIINELRTTKRYIVTNVPLVQDELAAYLQQKYGETFDLLIRLRMLEEHELRTFFLHPAPGLDITEKHTISYEDGTKSEEYDYSPRLKLKYGTLFVLDEVQVFYAAREWQKTGKDCLYYFTQHRKVSDDVIMITQGLGQIDKALRNLGQNYTHCANLGLRRLFRIAGPKRIVCRTYLTPVVTPTERPMETQIIDIEPNGIGKTYNTAAGVGMRGLRADTQVKRRGLHWSFLIVGVVMFGALLMLVPYAMGGGFRWLTRSHAKAMESATNAVSAMTPSETATLSVNVPQIEPQAQGKPQEQGRGSDVTVSTNEVFLTGYYILNRKAHVFLTDGREYTSDDTELTYLNSRFAMIEGKRYRFQPHASTPPAGFQFGRIPRM